MTNFSALAQGLKARPRQTFHHGNFRQSAVLVPILDPGELLFIVRTDGLRSHAGQIAFPGGVREPEDDFPIGTALRETFEELALPSDSVEVLGLLDDIPTPSGFRITPVVGRVAPFTELRLAPHEVASVFRVPLEELASRYSHDGAREFLGVTYVMHQYQWDEYKIWGATARMVYQLLELL